MLTGEGADELFAGYNEFTRIPKEKINIGCLLLLESMSVGNLARVDKLAMRHTLETRCSFFDNVIIDYALNINGESKVGEHNGILFTKLILRNTASRVLPEEIAFRHKEPFANGAGMDVGLNYNSHDGVLSVLARESGRTEQEVNTEIYNSFHFNKFIQREVVVKDNLISTICD